MKNHIKELDGLRGVAILLVMLYHLFDGAVHFTDNVYLVFITKITSVGWAGVDIFFTLSGFLITSILLTTKSDENYYKNFYVRRVLRIFPLYYFTIGIVIFFAPKLEPAFIQNLKYSLPIMLLYGQNWLLLYDPNLLTNYLGVTWSLAIEEQYYLIWPFIVKQLNKKKLIIFSLTYILLVTVIQISTVLISEDRAGITFFYYLSSFSRFEEMLIGSLLAIWFTTNNAFEKIKKLSLPVFISATFIFISLCLIGLPNLPNPVNNILITLGGYKSLSLITAGLIGIFVTYPSESWMKILFQNKSLIFFGKYSYSMYLFHEIVGSILFSNLQASGLYGSPIFFLYVIASFGITILTSLMTWHFLEKHLLGLKKYFEYKNTTR